MGCVFESQDVTIWKPSQNVGRLFLCCLREIESILCHESGLVEYMSDTIEVDQKKLMAFILDAAIQLNLSNRSLSCLVGSVFSHLVAMLILADSSVNVEFPAEWKSGADQLLREWPK